MKSIIYMVSGLIVAFVSMAVLQAAQCSGQKVGTGTCTASRACTPNHTAQQCDNSPEIMNSNVQVCVSGLPADNCVATTTQEVCATVYDCQCTWAVSSYICLAWFSYNVSHNKVQVGGDCNIGG